MTYVTTFPIDKVMWALLAVNAAILITTLVGMSIIGWEILHGR